MYCTRGSLKIHEAKMAKNSPSAHHRTTLPGSILITKAHIDNRKNFLDSNISPTCLHNMVNFDPLAAEICWRVSVAPANFNGFRVPCSVTARHSSSGVSKTLRRWKKGATYIRQGGHHAGHWSTFEFLFFFFFLA